MNMLEYKFYIGFAEFVQSVVVRGDLKYFDIG